GRPRVHRRSVHVPASRRDHGGSSEPTVRFEGSGLFQWDGRSLPRRACPAGRRSVPSGSPPVPVRGGLGRRTEGTMSAEHEGPAGGRNPEGPKNAAKPPRGGSSLTDAVVAALAKVDDPKAEKPAAPAEPAPAEAGCAATAQAPKEPPPVVASAPQPALVEPAIVQ